MEEEHESGGRGIQNRQTVASGRKICPVRPGASTSRIIPSNIAEGHGRYSSKELIQFLSVAKGPLYELTTQLLIGEQVHYLDAEQIQPAMAMCNEIERMLTSLIRSISESNV